jgi:serine/threonine protein kinase/Tfp pilus assembly protein PilF
MTTHNSVDVYGRLSSLEEGEELSLYSASDPLTGKKVALWIWTEVPNGNIPTEATELHHVSWVPMLKSGEDSGTYFLAQELPEGKPLAKILEEGALPARKALLLIAQVASALTELHRRGELHGNLTPWSIFVPKEGKVRILGVGLHHLRGNPAYFSPEKARAQDLSPASDIFSLGTMLHESLTGFPTFSGETRVEILRAIVYSPPPRMQVARSEIPREVVQLTARCLAKEAHDRFADADAFLEELTKIALEKPERLKATRISSRRRRAWILAACLLLLGFPLGAWFFLRGASTPLSQQRDSYSGWQRVAVMEPQYVGEEPTRHYLVQGIVDEIVSALTANTTLDVISTLSTRVYRDSAKSAKQIAKELMVDGLIESTLIDNGEETKLHIRVADGKTGAYIWDHQLELSQETVFEIQDHLEAVLHTGFRPLWARTQEHLQRASTVEAYTLFLDGKQLLNQYTPEANRKSIERFQQALEKDPTFAPAWAALSRAYGNVVNVEESMEASWLDKAEEAAIKAIQTAPQLPDGYYARGAVTYLRHSYFGTADRSRALADLEQALRISPDYPDALLLKAFVLLSKSIESDELSLAEASIKLFQRALAIRPNLPNDEANYAFALAHTGNLDLAIDRLEQAVGNSPTSPQLNITLGNVLLLQGQPQRAVDVTEEAMNRKILASPLHQTRLAAFYAAAGNVLRAREILRGTRQPFHPYEDFYTASALAGIGSEKEALERLHEWKRKMTGRNEQVGLFRWWLRKDPNFRALRERGALQPFLRPPRDSA